MQAVFDLETRSATSPECEPVKVRQLPLEKVGAKKASDTEESSDTDEDE